MIVRRERPATATGPAEWFTGDVFIDPIRSPDDDSRLSVANVHFAPGARTAWHAHPHGQTLYVTDGVGHVARRGGEVETILPGDVVRIAPGEEHWHGASADHFMAHIAMNEVGDDGSPATWGEHVTDAEYAAGAGRG